MANMSYCRFRNTRPDLNACLDALNGDRSLSKEEAGEGRRMFKDFLDFCQENLIISSYDADEVDDLFSGLTEKEDDDE